MYDYEAWPYKDANGVNLDIGDLVKLMYGDNLFRIVIFSLDGKTATIQLGMQQFNVPTMKLRWIR